MDCSGVVNVVSGDDGREGDGESWDFDNEALRACEDGLCVGSGEACRSSIFDVVFLSARVFGKRASTAKGNFFPRHETGVVELAQSN